MKKIIRLTTTATDDGREISIETDADVNFGKYAKHFTDPEGFKRDFYDLFIAYNKRLDELIMKYGRKEEKHDGDYAI